MRKKYFLAAEKDEAANLFDVNIQMIVIKKNKAKFSQ